MEIEEIKKIQVNFILATGRTGSTLLCSMFNAHPNIISTSEEPFAYNLHDKYKKVKVWTSKTIEEFCYDFYLFSAGRLEVQFGTKKDLIQSLERHKQMLDVDLAIRLTYLCFFPNKEKNKISTVVDKQLKFHYVLSDVAKIYPQSKFIILYREPRDNALAKWRMFEKLKTSRDYFHIACNWKYVYKKLINLKNKIGKERFMDVKYEELVSNPEFELKKICSFLQVPYNENMLNFDKEVRNELKISTPKFNDSVMKTLYSIHEGLTEKVNTNKIDFWKTNMQEKDANIIWTICGELAVKIGYKKDSNFVKQKFTLKNYLTYIMFILKRAKTTLYYSLPFFVKHFIKKARYGKHFKVSEYTSHEFNENSFHN